MKRERSPGRFCPAFHLPFVGASVFSPHRNVQVVTGPEVPAKTHRRHRSLLESARQGDRALCRRKEPNSSIKPHSAWLAAEEGPLRNDDPRLQAKRDNDAFRRTGCAARKSHRGLSQATPASGVLEVSSMHRPRVSGQRASPSGDRELRHRRGQGLAQQAFSLRHALCATSCSWLTLIEHWFAKLTNTRIRRD
jgi:hypothetical protein